MLNLNIGSDIPTTVWVRDNQTLYIKHKWKKEFSFDISKIQRLYVKTSVISIGKYLDYGKLYKYGFVYISLDGDIKDNPLGHKQSFQYTRKYQQDIVEFVQYLQYMNKNIEVIQVKRFYNLHKDRAVKENRTPLICPSCQSVHVHYRGNQRKRFSVKKALVGGLLTGGIGAVAGFAGKKGQDQWQCSQCGNVFDTHPQ